MSYGLVPLSMRSLLPGLLLACYLSSLLAPVAPLAGYWLNREYIAQELCVNRDKPASCCEGACYLTRQISQASRQQQDQPDGQSAPSIDLEKLPVSLPAPELAPTSPIGHLSCPPLYALGRYEDPFSGVDTPPPAMRPQAC